MRAVPCASRVTGASSTIATSSWSATVVPVPIVTVPPAGTLSAAPLPAARVSPRCPAWSNTSSPTSTGVDPTLVHTTSVCRLWFFTTAGRTATSRAAPPPPWLEKVGSGVSVTPPRTRVAGPATRPTVASRQKARRNVMEKPAPGAADLRGTGGGGGWGGGGGGGGGGTGGGGRRVYRGGQVCRPAPRGRRR